MSLVRPASRRLPSQGADTREGQGGVWSSAVQIGRLRHEASRPDWGRLFVNDQGVARTSLNLVLVPPSLSSCADGQGQGQRRRGGHGQSPGCSCSHACVRIARRAPPGSAQEARPSVQKNSTRFANARRYPQDGWYESLPFVRQSSCETYLAIVCHLRFLAASGCCITGGTSTISSGGPSGPQLGPLSLGGAAKSR